MTRAFVMASDENVVVPLGVVVGDLGRLTPPDSRLVVLHQGIDANQQEWLRREAGANLDVAFTEVRPNEIAGIELPDHLPPATLFRLLIGEVLDPSIDRVVYLDVDVLVREDPTPLFDVPTGAIAAARDTFRPWVAGRPALPWRPLGVDPATAYFNAGVLALDLAAWRTDAIGTRCLALLRDHPMPYGDQDALNLVVAGSHTEIDPRWNVQTDLFRDVALGWVTAPRDVLEDAVQDPAIVHFTGPTKPWHAAPTTRFAREWYDALARTGRPDWRPPAPPAWRLNVERARRRVARAIAGR